MVEGEPIQTGDRGSCRRHEFGLRRRVVRCICVAPVVALLVLIGGFLWFALHIANEESPLDRAADGIVALTGGASRITDAVELLASGRGRRLLITGVGPTTNTAELIRLAPDYERWFSCCIDLDYTAINTVGNAAQTRRWARERGFRSLVVVTSGYHMPRALLIARRAKLNVGAFPTDWRGPPTMRGAMMCAGSPCVWAPQDPEPASPRTVPDCPKPARP